MVHQALSLSHHYAKFRALSWILPLICFVITTGKNNLQNCILHTQDSNVYAVVGFMAEVTPLHGNGTMTRWAFISEIIALSSNILLNTYGPLCIAIRLFLYRWTVVAQFGSDAPTARYLHIVGIILQSAILNVPIMIVGTIGLVHGSDFGGGDIVSISVVIQVCG